MTVIKHDFGEKKRKAVRRFRKLLRIDALHEANVRANPLPYLERASERIYQLERTLFEAAQAATPSSTDVPAAERIEIDKAEYERLKTCWSIVQKGLADLGSVEDQD